MTGGIGSGKTTVTDYLATRGWPVVDADVIARDVVEPGRPAWVALRDAFGDGVLDAEGRLDRAFLADVVFSDPTARRRLEAITHPAVGRGLVAGVAAARTAGAPVVVVAIPLLRPEHRELLGLTFVVAVATEPAVALERLVQRRGMRPDDARARLAAQPSNEARAAFADAVVENDGTLEQLRERVDRVLAEAGIR